MNTSHEWMELKAIYFYPTNYKFKMMIFLAVPVNNGGKHLLSKGFFVETGRSCLAEKNQAILHLHRLLVSDGYVFHCIGDQ